MTKTPAYREIRAIKRSLFYRRIWLTISLFVAVACTALFITGKGWHWAVIGGIVAAIFIDFMALYTMQVIELGFREVTEERKSR